MTERKKQDQSEQGGQRQGSQRQGPQQGGQQQGGERGSQQGGTRQGSERGSQQDQGFRPNTEPGRQGGQDVNNPGQGNPQRLDRDTEDREQSL